jgi:hypothetical protein
MFKVKPLQVAFAFFGAIIGTMVDGFPTIIGGVLVGLILGEFIK